MNTEDFPALPDEKWLTRLANEFFAFVPGEARTPRAHVPSDSGAPLPGVPGDVNGISALSRPGASPSYSVQPNPFNLRQPPAALPDPHYAGAGRVPQSVAGSAAAASGYSVTEHGRLAGVDAIYRDPLLFPSDPVAAGEAVSKLIPSVSSPAGAGIITEGFMRAVPGVYHGYLPAADPGGIAPVVSGGPRAYAASPSVVSAQPRLTAADSGAVAREAESFNFLHESVLANAGQSGADMFAGALLKQGLQPSKVHAPFDLNQVRRDFPILGEQVNGKPLVWFDNAATTQKPNRVIDRLSAFYRHENSNIHRAAHELAARATDAYEEARGKVQHFIRAASPNEIVFVRGTTEAINLVANTWAEKFLRAGDEIVLSHLEHHANIVPWQQLASRKGLLLRVIPVDDQGQIMLDQYAHLLNNRTKLVAFSQVSNALGTVTPAKIMVDMAHAAGARVLVDGAQSVSHMTTDVQYLDADWFVFSGHKVFGPTGIGVLYGKEALLNEAPPWQGGGNMIRDVTFQHTEYHAAPSRFEAGTGNIADAVGLGAALDYVSVLGMENIHAYEHALLQYATHFMTQVPGLRLIGTAPDKASVLSFVLEGYSTEEVGSALNLEGIAVRSGHHCAQPILRRFGLESTVRPSLAFYNTSNEVDLMVAVLWSLASKR